MKNLILIICLMFTTLSYSNNIDSLNINESETERIIDKYGGKIVEGFNSFVETATPYAKEGFEVVVKLKIAEGIYYLFPLLLGFLFFRLYFIFANKSKTIKERYGSTDHYEIFAVVSLILGIIFTIASGFTTYHAITHLIAPEWFAIKEIIELIK